MLFSFLVVLFTRFSRFWRPLEVYLSSLACTMGVESELFHAHTSGCSFLPSIIFFLLDRLVPLKYHEAFAQGLYKFLKVDIFRTGEYHFDRDEHVFDILLNF